MLHENIYILHAHSQHVKLKYNTEESMKIILFNIPKIATIRKLLCI